MIGWLVKQALTPAGKAVGAVLVIIGIGYSIYAIGYHRGRTAILERMASDRVQVLIDGKEIDNAVLGSDDSALCDRLGGCL